ncbi:MerR family transcriptional regulator [Amylibacter sp. SFDW26]|uniref:MerR family transcriptional regulator n=1 Tax=Amylibacter sp. SFDW26 TaxID=2652722 RepID=UPI001D034B85|nr:MerR family transcriptional regulator [Amylibacter sp. SFDW26]
MAKSADAFRTISEVAEWLDTPAHVLRFWESRFTQIKPVKRAGGRRYYRPADMLLLGGIKKMLHDDGITIKGAQKILREDGIKHVQSLSQPVAIQVTIKKKTEAATKTPETVTASQEPIVEEQVGLLDEVADITKQEDETVNAASQQNDDQDLKPDNMNTTQPNADETMPISIIKMPQNIKLAADISAINLQDIEALYFSLKMVRNNMQRATAGA